MSSGYIDRNTIESILLHLLEEAEHDALNDKYEVKRYLFKALDKVKEYRL